MPTEASMPPVVRRLHTRFARLTVAAILLATVCFTIFALATLRIVPYPMLWFALGVLLAVLSFASPFLQVHMLSSLRKRAREADWHLCPHCGYDLRAGGDRCPECGRTRDAERDARSWQASTDLTLRREAD
jgi:hypothetical protein